MASLSGDPLSVQFLGPWFWSMLPGHNPVADALPWMTFRAIRWLKSYLRPGMSVFEYGAGGSTLFFAERVGSVVSVENDPRWHGVVARAVEERRLTNCNVRLVPARRVSSSDVPLTPDTDPTDPEFPGQSLEAYVRSIDAYPDGSFDLVSVDGYARRACVARAISKVRPGRYLLFDNSDWEVYRDAVALLDAYPRTDFPGAGPFQPWAWQTSVWRM